MNTNIPAPTAPTRLHPLVATAAVAVTVLSLTGVAALTGVLPFGKSAAPGGEMAAAPAVVAPVAAVPPAPTPVAPPAASEPQVVEKIVEKIVYVEKPAPKPASKPAPRPVAKAPAPAVDAVTPPPPAPVAAAPAVSAPPPPLPCLSCGVVSNVREVTQPGDASGLGAVAGGVVGGIVGNQIGKGGGNKVATVLGAAGGAYAGHQIEKSQKKTTRYEIDVRMNDGSQRTLAQDTVPAWRIGDRVRVENNGLVADNTPPAAPR